MNTLSQNPKQRKQVYAIIRADLSCSFVTPIDNIVTVTRIVDDIKEAEKEVTRLSNLKSEKGCKYWWQTTRLYSSDLSTNPDQGESS